jgi:hypothetical protein
MIGLSELHLEMSLSHAEARRPIALHARTPLLSHTVIKAAGTYRPRLQFHHEDIDAFKAEYTTLSALCRETGRHHALFRRSDIPPNLRS